ncbi:MAG: polysaccharide deacetylase family protein [Terriglobales bacterium]
MIAALARRLPEPVFRALAPRSHCIAALHRIAAGDSELDYPPAKFAELCRYWRDHYETLTLDCLLARLAHGHVATQPALVITFDDGYADNAETAADILDRYGLNATFFIPTGAMGGENRFPWDKGQIPRPRLMTWQQVGALHAAGFGIGSHTVTHTRLSAVRGGDLAVELSASRARLEAELGEPVLDFAYPFGGPGDCDFTARTAVRAAGYRCCLSCHGGLVAPGDSPWRLHRIAVSPRWHANPRAWTRACARLRWHRAPLPVAAHW